MPQAAVQMKLRSVTEFTKVIDIQGEVTGFAENALMEAYSAASNAGAINIILNFTDVEFMNSSGIGLLVTLLIRAKRQNQRLFAYGLSEHYEKIFELTRLNEAITIFSSEEEAVAAV